MKSQLMTQSKLLQLQQSAKTLEQDERGIKVSLLPSGNMLKVFRLRRKLSLAYFFSYANQFVKNAQRLKAKGVASLVPTALYRIQNSTSRAVEYLPLPGDTVRILLKSGKTNTIMLQNLGKFIASLHQNGIYFRSMHLGNLIAMPNGEFGLIDIADMRIFAWPLHWTTRLRNFDRIKKYDEDMQYLDTNQRLALMQAYLDASQAQSQYNPSLQTRFLNYL